MVPDESLRCSEQLAAGPYPESVEFTPHNTLFLYDPFEYCDMTRESQNSPLLDNGSLGTYPPQRLNTEW
jgi:hypothetical protein